MIRAFVFGATGYTGVELIRILSSHPEVKISGGSSRNWAGKSACSVFPYLPSHADFRLSTAEEAIRDPDGDVAFLALPHGESSAIARSLLDAGLKVVDLSADHRISDAEIYAKWYGRHKDPELLKAAVYGLPEMNRDAIRAANLIANPGCYPTSVILGAAPLLSREEIDSSCLVVDSKSGVSGAGRGAKLATSFCEAGEGFKPYSVTGHRHIPEMEQELTKIANRSVKVRFTPHLIPVSRGMVSTIYLRLEKGISNEDLRAAYLDRYRSEPFIRVLPAAAFPDTLMVRGSNQCHVSVEIDERTGWVVAISAIDNLTKGASGLAVQNMNVMFGFDETAGLEGLPLFP